MTRVEAEKVAYVLEGLEAIIFAADGDQRKSIYQNRVFCMHIFLYFPVLVTVFGNVLQGDGSEYLKTKRGFCQAQANSQKPPSVFQ